MRYEARAPLRVDFGGGWTDVPIYAQREGGAVLNAAITRYARGFIARPDTRGILHTLRGDRSYLQYVVDVPFGAGLGSSAAQTVLWTALVKTTIANTSDRREIAEIACSIASLMGILGGKQDEYAAALGRIHYFTFDTSVQVQEIDLAPPFRDRLRSRLVLVYSGERRLSGTIHEHVWGRYEQGEAATVGALAALKRLAGEMKDALLRQDLDAFGELMSENWANQKRLHPSVSDQRLDKIFALARREGAIGGKACGAGGGGCAIFLARDGGEEKLRRALGGSGLQVIDFDFDSYGVFLKKG